MKKWWGKRKKEENESTQLSSIEFIAHCSIVTTPMYACASYYLKAGNRQEQYRLSAVLLAQ